MIVAVVCLLTVIAIVSVNAYFVEKNLTEILDILEEVPAEIASVEASPHITRVKCKEALDKWRSGLSFLSLSIDRVELRDSTRAIEYLYALTDTSETADFVAALYEAKLRIELLCIREGISLINVA